MLTQRLRQKLQFNCAHLEKKMELFMTTIKRRAQLTLFDLGYKQIVEI